MGESPSSKSVRNISEMKLLAVTAVSLWLLLAVCQADKTAGHVNNNIQVPAASSGAGINPYYSEYDYNLYEPQTSLSTPWTDRPPSRPSSGPPSSSLPSQPPCSA